MKFVRNKKDEVVQVKCLVSGDVFTPVDEEDDYYLAVDCSGDTDVVAIDAQGDLRSIPKSCTVEKAAVKSITCEDYGTPKPISSVSVGSTLIFSSGTDFYVLLDVSPSRNYSLYNLNKRKIVEIELADWCAVREAFLQVILKNGDEAPIVAAAEYAMDPNVGIPELRPGTLILTMSDGSVIKLRQPGYRPAPRCSLLLGRTVEWVRGFLQL